jgi:serine/threonine protein kinase
MGEVYEAFDPKLDRRVAIKVLHTGIEGQRSAAYVQELRGRLFGEARALAVLSHPNIIPIFDVGIFDEGSFFLTMEFVAGTTLSQAIKSKKKHWRSLLSDVLQAGEGLAAAHAAGLLHRDFKPDNVMIGGDGVVRVLDFGLSKRYSFLAGQEQPESTPPATATPSDSRLRLASPAESGGIDHTSVGVVLGTPAYMPPEQVCGAATNTASDLFSFCSVIYEVLTRRRPFPSGPANVRLAAIADPHLKFPRHVPLWLQQLVAHGLAYEPDARGPGMRELIDTIRVGLRRDLNRRKAWIGGLGAGLTATALVLFQQEPKLLADPDCADPSELLAELWSGNARALAKAGFERNPSVLARKMWQENEAALDRWHHAWIDAAKHLCSSTRQALGYTPFDAGLREQSRACLNESREEVRTLLEIWREPTTRHILNSANAIESVTRPSDCVNTELLRDRTPLPADPERRQWVLAQQDLLAVAEVRAVQADYDGAKAILKSVSDELTARFDLGLQAKLAVARGILMSNELEYSRETTHALRSWNLWALAAGEAESNANSLYWLWYRHVSTGNLRDESEEIFGNHLAAIERASFPPRRVSDLAQNRGVWALMQGNAKGAIEHFQRAVELDRATDGEVSHRTAISLSNLGEAELLVGKWNLAVTHQRQALDTLVRVYPPGHPVRSYNYALLAIFLADSGRLEEAFAVTSTGLDECIAAEVPAEMYASLHGEKATIATQAGEFRVAFAAADAIAAMEREFGRRISESTPWSESFLARALAGRGEVRSAYELAEFALSKLGAQRDVPAAIFLDALLVAADAAIACEDFERAWHYLDQADAIDRNSGEDTERLFVDLIALRGRLYVASNQPQLALVALEEALAGYVEIHDFTQRVAGIHREMAHMHLLREELDSAAYHAEQARHHYQTLSGLAPHTSVVYHATLAEVLLADRRPGDALLQLEAAQQAFDSIEVLANRRAPLHFLEAQAWWQLEATAQGRAHARELAKQALREYADWEAGARAASKRVRQWLARH